MSKGYVTIPTDKTFVEGTKKYIEMWGADAIRDCDGVSLPDDLKQFGTEVYKAYFIIREDHEYAKKHHEYLQNVALTSKRVLATSRTLKINLLEDTFKESLEVNLDNYKKYWQVFDRTSGEQISSWEYIGNDYVEIKDAIPFHEYSVNFFARNLWDPVQIYNYHVNDWTCERDIDLDPIYPEALNHMLERMESWLQENKDVTVVRFTTFFYNFFIVYKTGKVQRIWDWHIYAMSASPAMFEEFKKEYGYEMTLEDLISEGYYSNKTVIPTKAMMDYVDLVQRKCCAWAKLFVDLCHKYGKKAMMFDGDHRIGIEPYNKYFPTVGLDAVVGAPSSGIYIQQIANMPGVKYTEGRFSPYFFPNECPGDKKGTELLTNFWNSEKRGMLRKAIDRIGFGGYLRQVDEYPNFIKKVTEVCNEFRAIKENAGKEGSQTFLHVAVVSYWGKLDSWMYNNNFVDLYHQEGSHLHAVLDALSGQPVKVDFLSFDELLKDDLSKYDSILSMGIAHTAYQGDYLWKNPKLVEKIREYVWNGGSFFGMGEPSGFEYQGKYFQLGDVLGVQKENNHTLFEKRNEIIAQKHWITDGIDMSKITFGIGTRNIYPLTGTVLAMHYDEIYPKDLFNAGHVDFAVNEYGKGRAAYFSGLSVNNEAYRLIYKTLLWLSRKESYMEKAITLDSNIDTYYYKDKNCYALLNNSGKQIKTVFIDIDGKKVDVTLNPFEIKWLY